MFGYWIAHVTYGYSAIDWHRERIDNSWALALAMGGLVLAVYFCYSLHGVTLARASINLKLFGSFCPNSLQQFDVLRDTAFI